MKKISILTYVIVGFCFFLLLFSVIGIFFPELISKIPNQKQNKNQELIGLAEADILNQNYIAAQKKYYEILKTDAQNTDALINLSQVVFAQGNISKAKSILENNSSSSKSIYLLSTLANFYLEERDYNNAENIYKNIIQLYPNTISSYIVLANIYNKTGNWDVLIQTTQKAIEIKSSFVDSYISSIENEINFSNPSDKEKEILQKLLHAGLLTENMLNYDKISFRKSFIKDKKVAILYNMMATGYAQKFDFDKSTFYYQKALEFWPDYMDAERNLAIIQQYRATKTAG